MSLDAAGLQVGEHLHPELGALVVLEPHAEHFAVAVHRDRQREVAGLALHRAAVTDLQHQRIEEHDRVDVIERPGLPGAGVFHDRVGHPADQVAADLDPVDLLQVRLDVPGRQAAAVERQDLVVEPLEPPLPLPHDLRLERPVPIAGRLDPHLALLGEKRLRASTRSACCPPLRAAPGAARSRDGRSARPPTPAPPAAWSTATSSPPRPVISSSVLAPASSSSSSSSGRSAFTSSASSGLRPAERAAPARRFARPPGSLRSTPARPGSLDSSNLLGIVVDTDLLSMIHAYTVSRTIPCSTHAESRCRAGLVRGVWSSPVSVDTEG